MRLTVLGGSAAGINPGQGCSGYLVETTATRLVLDLGPGTLVELRRHTNFRTLSAVVISHLHVDHILDLVALRFALAYNPEPPPGRIPLWLPPGGTEFLRRLATAFTNQRSDQGFFDDVFDVAEYDPDGTLVILDARLTFAPTVHFVPCWAIRVAGQRDRGDLSYTADSGPAADLAAFAAGSAVVIAEATYLEPPDQEIDERGHLTAAEAGALARTAGASVLVLSHLWEELGFDRYRDRAAAEFSGRLELARPGLHIEW